jgi:hypothetical protein
MFPFLRHFSAVVILTSLLILANPGHVFAGWMGFRNDTQMTLIVQESVTTGKSTRAGKRQKIFANETVRDSVASSGNRTFTIFDSAKPDKPIYTGSFPSPPGNENFLFVLKSDGKGGLIIEAQRNSASVSKSRPKR